MISKVVVDRAKLSLLRLVDLRKSVPGTRAATGSVMRMGELRTLDRAPVCRIMQLFAVVGRSGERLRFPSLQGSADPWRLRIHVLFRNPSFDDGRLCLLVKCHMAGAGPTCSCGLQIALPSPGVELSLKLVDHLTYPSISRLRAYINGGLAGDLGLVLGGRGGSGGLRAPDPRCLKTMMDQVSAARNRVTGSGGLSLGGGWRVRSSSRDSNRDGRRGGRLYRVAGLGGGRRRVSWAGGGEGVDRGGRSAGSGRGGGSGTIHPVMVATGRASLLAKSTNSVLDLVHAASNGSRKERTANG